VTDTRPVRYPPGYPLQVVPPDVPVDDEDRWLLLHGDYDEGEGWG
jgi:hypothetical protein